MFAKHNNIPVGKISTTSLYTLEQFKQSTLNSSWAAIPVIEEMPKLEHVKAFQSDYPTDVVALLEDGAVKVLGSHLNDKDLAAVHAWKDILAITKPGNFVVGLQSDGYVVAAGEYPGRDDVNQWKDIVAVSAYNDTFGLKRDGTVVAAGLCKLGGCKVEDWTDIIAIAAGAHHAVGLKRDGTVISTGDNRYGQRNVEAWMDIVAVDASYYYTIGLKRDGTLVLAGDSSKGGTPTPDVSNISGLWVPTSK